MNIAEILDRFGDDLVKTLSYEELTQMYGPQFVAWYKFRRCKMIEILERTNSCYTLVNNGGTYQPFVVAFLFDENSGEWAQGHYFSTEEDARSYLAYLNREVEKTTKKTKLFRTKSLKEKDWDGNSIKYRWYKRTYTNRYGSWVENIFTYDGTDTEYADYETENETEAEEWFNGYK